MKRPMGGAWGLERHELEWFFRFAWWYAVTLATSAARELGDGGVHRHLQLRGIGPVYRTKNSVERHGDTTRKGLISSLRSGLKARACGGLDPLILCPFLKPF